MNVLKKTKTYLVGPMEYALEGAGRFWRQDMTKFLRERNVTVFDPYDKPFVDAPSEDENTHELMRKLMRQGKFQEVHEHYKQVRALDLSMVDRSDFIVGYINPAVPTYGTTEELVTAVRMKRPVFLVIEGGMSEAPFWLLGMLPPKCFYNNFDEVKDMIARIDEGEKKINNERWRLFKDKFR